MSDQNTAQPVRTEVNGAVVASLVDFTTNTQGLGIDASGRITIKLDDGAGNSVTSQVNGAQRALDVGINVAGVQIDPRAIRALTSTDQVTVVQGTSPWVTKDQSDGPVTPGTVASFSQLIGGQFNTVLPTLTTGQQAAIQVDASGRIIVGSIATALPAGTNSIGKVAQDNTTQWITSDLADGSVAGGTAGSKSMLAGLVFNTAAPTLTNGQQASLQGDASGNLKVTLTTALPAGANNIGSVNQGTSPWVTSDLADGSVAAGTAGTKSMLGGAVFNTSLPTLTTGQQAALQSTSKGELITIMDIGGAPISATNPVPVQLTSALAGTSVNDYNTAAALAAGGTSNHDYTITSAKTFNGKKIWAAASGKLKVEVQISADGTSFTTKWVGFNSTSTPNISIDLDELVFLESGVGSKIRIIRTNKDLLAMDVYSTISGTEV